MIKHIMMAKLADASPDKLNEVKDKLMSMEGRVPEIIEIKVGADILHTERSYDIVLEVVVADRKALEKYMQNEYHCKVVKPYMLSVRTASAIVDYEM